MAASTENRPLRFFYDFFGNNDIENEKRLFLSSFPNPEDPDCQWARYPCTVVEDGKSFKVQYEVEIGEDHNGVPMYEWREKLYNINSHLETLFKREYFRSKRLLDDKLTELSKGNPYYFKNYLKDTVNNCLSLLASIEDNVAFSIYPECSRPFKAIIRDIYKGWRDRLPRVQSEQIKSILSDRNETEPYVTRDSFNIQIVERIMDFRCGGNDAMDFFDLEESEDYSARNDIKGNLRNLIRGDLDAMSLLTIHNNVIVFHYLLRKISDMSGVPDLKSLEMSNKLRMGSIMFNVSRNQTYYQRCATADSYASCRVKVDQLLHRYLR